MTTTTIKARFEDGRIVPLEPLDVEEGAELVVTLTRPEPSTAPSDPTTATAGAWKDLLDCEAFEQEVYQNRLVQTRPEVCL